MGRRVENQPMSVIMSVMKAKPKSNAKKKPQTAKRLPSVFTVRDMNRNTATVLEACRQNGRIIVRHRSGEEFEMTPAKVEKSAQPRPDFMARMEAHWQRMRDLGVRPATTPGEVERINQIIAGEV